VRGVATNDDAAAASASGMTRRQDDGARRWHWRRDGVGRRYGVSSRTSNGKPDRGKRHNRAHRDARIALSRIIIALSRAAPSCVNAHRETRWFSIIERRSGAPPAAK